MTTAAARAPATTWLTPSRAGWAGVGLGVIAFFIAVPPLLVRSPIPVVLVGLAAVAAGAIAVRGGERRLGWGAVAAGVLGAAGGIAATQSGVGNLERVVVWSALFAAMLRFATPLLFAALGGLFSERSGVVNIGLEGMMLMGAFFGIWGADVTGSWLGGLLIGMVAGALLALIHAAFSVSLRADQIVSGFALNFLALGITGYFFIDIYGTQGTPDNVARVPDVKLPLIEDIPFVGDIFGQLNLLIWLGLLAVLLTWVVVFRTPVGLRLRAAGENPLAAETAGLSVVRTRYLAVVTSGVLAATGGAYLSIAFVGSFVQNMTAGRGFIALAVLICGRWRPGGALAFALLFGFSSALAQRLPAFSPSAATLFQALPYVLTLVAVAGVIGRSTPPLALGRPLEK
jgi:general nucleoside transport system permease protein